MPAPKLLLAVARRHLCKFFLQQLSSSRHHCAGMMPRRISWDPRCLISLYLRLYLRLSLNLCQQHQTLGVLLVKGGAAAVQVRRQLVVQVQPRMLQTFWVLMMCEHSSSSSSSSSSMMVWQWPRSLLPVGLN